MAGRVRWPDLRRPEYFELDELAHEECLRFWGPYTFCKGTERGAFTGALSQKIGRFELAHRGTLFLDEVGDIPLDLQPKLLRALQEKAFERLGGTKTIPIDVRLLAATNRNLTQMMGDKLFRSDLYYRLKVFPITTPPLRDHAEDIPVLARYFTQKYAQEMNKQIDKIPVDTMRALMSYSWPGNVRELENFIERAVILSRGPNLRAPLAEIRPDVADAGRQQQHAGTSGTGVRHARAARDGRGDQQGCRSSRNASDDFECSDAQARHLSQGTLRVPRIECVNLSRLRVAELGSPFRGGAAALGPLFPCSIRRITIRCTEVRRRRQQHVGGKVEQARQD